MQQHGLIFAPPSFSHANSISIATSISIVNCVSFVHSIFCAIKENNLQECKISKTFGDESDNVVFVLDQGIFNITALVNTMTTGLTSVLGEFTSLTGDIVAAPTVSPLLAAVNAATALLG